MKLAKFSRLDPTYSGKGLERGGQVEAATWDEFSNNRDSLREQVTSIRKRVSGERARKYWALFANPDVYNIGAAIRDLDEDLWVTRGRDIQQGDRVMIWKGAGGGKQRGVIALGEVVGPPTKRSDSLNPYWVNPSDGNSMEERVAIKYVTPSRVPLWIGDSNAQAFEGPSVARARGGTVCHLDESEWQTILDRVGGWPAATSSEAAAVRRAVSTQPDEQRGHGQRFLLDSRARKSVEAYAMNRAINHFESQGWDAKDVSRLCSFDLLCRKRGVEMSEMHVEVKGTTTRGEEVIPTDSEVRHANSFGLMALYICANIRLSTDERGEPITSGGVAIVEQPWQLNKEALTPIAYCYSPKSVS
ncbi:MAG: EVE domain-containing protein [SAR202 cluster bacterium]|nr:EVE domain-containing protein [SAR202 cluster bacterium]